MICFADADAARRLAAAVAVAALVAVGAGCASGGIQSTGRDTELINPFLGPGYTQWMVGPISRLATAEEKEVYLALRDAAAAAEFIDAFWERRDPAPLRPDNPLRNTFEERAAEADRRFSEGTYPGRRTDRGTTYVLFGEPEETDYEISPHPDDPPIEVWRYPPDAEPGLSGEPPVGTYRFIKRRDLTTFYTSRSLSDQRGPRRDRF